MHLRLRQRERIRANEGRAASSSCVLAAAAFRSLPPAHRGSHGVWNPRGSADGGCRPGYAFSFPGPWIPSRRWRRWPGSVSSSLDCGSVQGGKLWVQDNGGCCPPATAPREDAPAKRRRKRAAAGRGGGGGRRGRPWVGTEAAADNRGWRWRRTTAGWGGGRGGRGGGRRPWVEATRKMELLV